MDKTQEALKMAIEYLTNIQLDYKGHEVRKACKEALAQPTQEEKFCDENCVWTDHHPNCKLEQPAQEPVAWIDTKADIDEAFITNELKKAHIKRNSYCDNWNIPLYTHPAPQPADYLYVYKGSKIWLKDSLDIPSAGFLIGKIRLEK